MHIFRQAYISYRCTRNNVLTADSVSLKLFRTADAGSRRWREGEQDAMREQATPVFLFFIFFSLTHTLFLSYSVGNARNFCVSIGKKNLLLPLFCVLLRLRSSPETEQKCQSFSLDPAAIHHRRSDGLSWEWCTRPKRSTVSHLTCEPNHFNQSNREHNKFRFKGPHITVFRWERKHVCAGWLSSLDGNRWLMSLNTCQSKGWKAGWLPVK